MENEGSVTGSGTTIVGAFEDAAKKAAESYGSEGATREELEAEFRRRPFDASIQVIVQPHNQWVREYRVKLTR